ncbi:hypothetical protein HMPREF0501_00939 [Limosilactobacillus coleohominis 101-4-CHN]|uniref:Uncharacterized protein n=1 Tax=Limosilactobacillus coleohominis 101-4-CHN TaxID=575594 RepID=C7XV30_9LACO|nr:DUF6625 family protein [Limosilactobacillus coleohominis]EEU30561.1 hypothetical protein HMPREF0501_00939 [Limosilactobacillus coleohominis 101-4-CHN]
MQQNVVIIIPYYGQLPKNFQTFIETCRMNSKIDWLIVTDLINDDTNLPSNVKQLNWTFQKFVRNMRETIGKPICLKTPYKMCDYKPVYGEAFKKYIESYDYWGYSDMDVVYGNLWQYISTSIQRKIDKIGNWGHLTLFKNNNDVNSRYKLNIIDNDQQINLFNEMISTDDVTHFDETNGINKIYEKHHFSWETNKNLVNDIFFENLDLLSNDSRFFNYPGVFAWNNGNAVYYYQQNNQIKSQDFGYFHFQKRKFRYFLNRNTKMFYVNTTGYHALNSLDDETIKLAIRTNKSKFNKRLRYLLHNYFKTNLFTSRKIGSVYLPIKYIIWRIFKENNFII